MENALLVALSRQTSLRRSLDVIANNVANINTNGYKADGLIFEEFIMPSARGDAFAGSDRRVSFVNDRVTWTDMRTGAIQPTGNPLDVALEGRGFLTVQAPAGERYTRNGALQINATGTLVTSEGHPVQGEAGPIVFQPGDKGIVIARDGTITVAAGDNASGAPNIQRGRLRVVDFPENTKLLKDGASLFQAANGVAPQPAPLTSVFQGTLEKSNVQGVIEMGRLIEATRTYTTISQITEQQNTMRRSALERLAEVPN